MKEKQEKGFTLLELMVVVGISSVISCALFMALRMGSDQVETSGLRMTVQDQAREGLYKMIQEIRESAPSRIAIGGGGANIQFNIPSSNNTVNALSYLVDWTNALSIRYALGGINNQQIIRTNLNTGQTTVLANYVNALTFTGNAAQPSWVIVTMGVQWTGMNRRQMSTQLTGRANIRNT